MKLERFILVMTPEKDENFVCLSALLCEQILPMSVLPMFPFAESDLPQANHSQYSSSVEALNLIVV